jgi:hypothetical protein
MKLLVMQFSPPSCHFIPLQSKYSPGSLYLDTRMQLKLLNGRALSQLASPLYVRCSRRRLVSHQTLLSCDATVHDRASSIGFSLARNQLELM